MFQSKVLKRTKKYKVAKTLVGKIIIHSILLAGAFMMLIPFIWMVSTSLKAPYEIFIFPPKWIPSKFLFRNYIEAWQYIPFGRYLLNSTIIATSVTLGQLFSCSLAAYAFARLRFPGRGPLFLILLSTMMIPHQARLIPIFLIVKTFKWLNTYQALIIPGLASAWGTFLLRQFFSTIPKELEDAARIDGCSRLGILYRIFFPLARPALITLGLFTFLNQWNSFVWPLILTDSEKVRPIQVGLAMFRGVIGESATSWSYLMCGSIFAILPILVIFVAGQKYFIKGFVLSGLKG